MNTVFRRQRAERFAQLLDEAGGARRHHVRSKSDQELTELIDVSHRLGRIDFGVQADPEFKDGLRAMLMATIEREGIGATAVADEPTVVVGGTRRRTAGAGQWLPVRSRRARSAVVIGLAAGTLAVSGMSAASGDAMPGDTLYGMKRTGEKAQLAMASSQIGRGQLYLDFAKTRMNEAAAVRGGAPGLAGLLDEMDTETREGVKLLTTSAVDRRDPAPLDVVDVFTGQQRETLGGMLGSVNGNARNRTLGSLQLLDTIQRRSAELRGTLRCGDFAGMGIDELGPRPGRCVAQGKLQPANPGTGTNGGTAGRPDTGGNQQGEVTGGAGAPAGSPAGGPTTGNRPQPAGSEAPAGPAGTGSSPAAPVTPEDSRPANDDESLLDRIGSLLGG